jgi:hypothetical protein
VFVGLAALEVLEAVPLPVLVECIPPPRYVRDGASDVDVLEVMVPLLLPVLVPVEMDPESNVVEDKSEDNVIVVDMDWYVTLPVGKSPIALPVAAVPLSVTTDWDCAYTATAANSTVQIGGAIRYVKRRENKRVSTERAASTEKEVKMW